MAVLDGDGKPIVVGATVGFKQGTELYGKVKAISAAGVTIEYRDDRTDEKKTTTVMPRRCWQDD